MITHNHRQPNLQQTCRLTANVVGKNHGAFMNRATLRSAWPRPVLIIEAKIYLDTPHADVPGYFPMLSERVGAWEARSLALPRRLSTNLASDGEAGIRATT